MPPRKKKTDPNKPKGRTSAYAFFVKARRELYLEKGEQVQFTKFSKECADMWKDLNETDKEPFHHKAEGDRERYQREMAGYKPPSDDEEGGGGGRRRRRRKKKDKDTPKRSMSGFMFFSQVKRPKLRETNPNFSVGEIAKQLGAAWKIMTPEQKKPYEDMAKKDRKRYDEQMELYRQGQFKRAEPEHFSEEEDEDDDDEDED